jgi:hypothetical protein
MQLLLTRVRGQYIAHNSRLGLEATGATMADALAKFGVALDELRNQCAAGTETRERALSIAALYGGH